VMRRHSAVYSQDRGRLRQASRSLKAPEPQDPLWSVSLCVSVP
jgi:hypothetical protein